MSEGCSVMTRPKIDRKDWRNLPHEHWNVATVHAMVIELNTEHYGVETYVPFRNWGAERAIIKRALETYGAEVVAGTITEAFAEYKPTPQYPQLTAGFIFSYMASRIVPRLLADRQARIVAEEARRRAETMKPDEDEVMAWL